MRQTNKGNIVPFYKFNELKSETFFNSPTDHVVGCDIRLLPFQIILPITFLDPYIFALFNESGTYITTLTIDDYRTVTNQGSSYICATYFASINLWLDECEKYQVRIRKTSGTWEYFSEWIFYSTDWTHQITFTNANDIGNVMYQTNYVQKIYFNGYEDTPEIDLKTTTEIDLRGQEIMTSARQTERRILVGMGFIDSQLFALHSIELHTFITVNDRISAETTNVNSLQFSSNQHEDGTNLGTFKFITNIATIDGCGVNTFTI